MQQTDVREGVGLKLRKGDANGDNSLRFNVVNSRLMEDTGPLQKKSKRLWLCELCSPHVWGFSVLQNITSLFSDSKCTNQISKYLLHIDSEFIFIHMIFYLYYVSNLRKVIS